MAGIYIHIPFCRQACYYCDFHFSTQTATSLELTRCIVQEVALQRDYLGREPISTIYFGGGTPSILDARDLEMILSQIFHLFSVSENPEITLEANPDDLSKTKLDSLQTLGVNRLSIGIQSFNDRILKFLNRIHTSALSNDAVLLAREAGFKNISLDLIYAIPGQTEAEWQHDIAQAVALRPEHISAYALTIEEKTAFGRWAAKGKFIGVADDRAAEDLEILTDKLESSGYEHYEVSNFCRPGYHSCHNSNYWKQQKYLGVGPSAHSYNLTSRQHNVSNNHLYIQSIKEGKVPFELEVLTQRDRINEYLLTGLRTNWGCDLELLKETYQFDLLKSSPDFIEALIEKKLATLENSFLKLTRSGRLLADKITADLFLAS